MVGDGGVAHQDGGSGHIVYLVERCGGGFLVQKVLAKGCTVVVVARAGQYGKGQIEQDGGFAVLLGGVVVGDVAGDQECVGALGQGRQILQGACGAFPGAWAAVQVQVTDVGEQSCHRKVVAPCCVGAWSVTGVACW